MRMSGFFETHCHYYGDVPECEYLERAREAGVDWLLAIGADFPESETAARLAAADPRVFFTAGVHPHQAEKYVGDVSMFGRFTERDDFAAVGEIGLDYYYEHSDRVAQRRVMESLLAWALEIGKPAVIHCRDERSGNGDAYRDCDAILSDFARDGGRFVLHCFAGTVAWAERFLTLGAYLGVTGIVTFSKAENIRDVVRIIPTERLLLETDSPYLAPVPHRGKTNHPAFLPLIAEATAALRCVSFDHLVAQTTTNAFCFLGIPTKTQER